MSRNLFLITALIFLSASEAFSAANTKDQNASLDQAKQDYRVFLNELKKLNEQYKEVTNEVRKVIKEEGVPVIDENTGDLRVTHDLSDLGQKKNKTFGDVDIQEMDKEMVVKMDLPGVRKQDIQVSVEDKKMLKVTGTRETQKEEEKDSQGLHYQKIERQHGQFERLIELPALADDKGTDARYENGVLTVRIKKVPGVMKKEVTIPVQ